MALFASILNKTLRELYKRRTNIISSSSNSKKKMTPLRFQIMSFSRTSTQIGQRKLSKEYFPSSVRSNQFTWRALMTNKGTQNLLPLFVLIVKAITFMVLLVPRKPLLIFMISYLMVTSFMFSQRCLPSSVKQS